MHLIRRPNNRNVFPAEHDWRVKRNDGKKRAALDLFPPKQLNFAFLISMLYRQMPPEYTTKLDKKIL